MRRLALVLFLCPLALRAAPASKPPLEQVLAKLPAASQAEGQKLAAELLRLGPPAIARLCAMLKPAAQGGDVKVRYALEAVARYASRPGGDADRRLSAQAIARALAKPAPAEVKRFLIRRLEELAAPESLPALAAALREPATCEAAARALQAVGGPDAARALLDALPRAQGRGRVAIVQALAGLRAPAARNALAALQNAKDPALRGAVWRALAELGEPTVGDPLEKAMLSGPPRARRAAANAYFRWLRRRTEQGAKADVAARCRRLIQATKDPVLASRALAALTRALAADALPDLLAAARSPNREFRAAALKLAQNLPGPAVTRQFADALPRLAPEQKVEVLQMLSRRGDRAALPALLAALKDANADVRAAAIPAAARLAGAAAAPALLARLQTASPRETAAVKAALLRLKPTPKLLVQIAGALPCAPSAARVALLEVLAARRAASQAEAVFAQAREKDARVRAAALKALGDVCGPDAAPRLIALYLAEKSSRCRSAAAGSIVKVCSKIKDPAGRAKPVLDALAKHQGESRARLLKVLSRIGGPAALQAVLADMKSQDAVVANAAVRALADWRDASAADAMLQVVKTSSKPVWQVLCLRGYIRVIDAARMPADKKAEKLAEALRLAKRPDEKRQALAALSRVRSLPALQAAAACLDDPALAQEACDAVVKIACPVRRGRRQIQPGLRGAEVPKILKHALRVCRNGRLRREMMRYLESLPVPDELDLALGKPVKTNVPQEGFHAPRLAVDGDARDPSRSAWFGHTTPAWLQVDLGKEYEIDTAHVYFYWDGSRYYQYTIDVSLDGKTWKTVADLSRNTQPSTPQGRLVRFPAVRARYVRLRILKNSANPACHVVEFKVYEKGKHPLAPRPRPKPKPDKEGFVPLFNGKDLTGWMGSIYGYVAEDGKLVCLKEGGGNLYTDRDYSNFILRLEFKLPPGGNNGVGIRVPPGGGAAYGGMEIQVLDNSSPRYAHLHPYQYHGSIYGVVPAKRGFLKPVGQWNSEEILADGPHIKVTLNGTVIVDADLSKIDPKHTMDHRPHPGLHRKSGRICFCGHGCRVEFRNIRIKELPPGGWK